MSSPRRLGRDELADEPTAWPVTEQAELAVGHVFSMVRDTVRTPGGDTMTREYIRHPGAVGIIAVDDDERVVLVRQYRHPVAARLLEPPAGLLDVDGEDWQAAAARELAEEVGLAADTWHVLVDLYTSPGMGTEALRLFLARGLRPAPRPDGFVPAAEEAAMETVTADLDDVAAAVLAGRVGNPALCIGILATLAARANGYRELRPADAPWRAKDAVDGHALR